MIDVFKELWKRIDAASDYNQCFVFLKQKYSEKHRFYHNLGHINKCLRELNEYVLNNSILLNEIEFAVWYHDILYDPKKQDNEEESVKIAQDVCRESNLSATFGKTVEKLILSTKHLKEPEELYEKIIVDVDLAILGSDTIQYDEYESNIRNEYSFVNNLDFAIGRKNILKRFIEKKHIFNTEYFQNKYEIIARNNLERTICKY